MLNQVNTTKQVSLEDYRDIISAELYDRIIERGASLAGVRVANVNATPEGGGVAEILKSLVPLMQSLGIVATWHVMPPDGDFFAVTKQFHNYLQGKDGCLDPDDFQRYLRHNTLTAELMKAMEVDVWIIHDPQPLAAVSFLEQLHPAIWQCHIDTSRPHAELCDRLLPFVKLYDEVIFSMPEYMFPQLTGNNLHFFAPAIDPLTPKNRPMPRAQAREVMANLGLDPERPIVTQVSRFDPWKDPWGVIDAYRLAKKAIPQLQLALVGVMAAKDDPEAQGIAEDVIRYAGSDPDIHLFTDASQVGDIEVNAFQSGSEVVIQKSIREGFGLTVAEAMWKGTPVIGGDCGGIRLQIKDGQTGFLVRGPEMTSQRIVELINNPQLAARIGQAGRESVRENYLLPRLMLNYLDLIAAVLSRDKIAAGR